MALTPHRRIDVSGGFSADTDWEAANSLPNFTQSEDDLPDGDIIPFVPYKGGVLLYAELRSGMSDDATQVATGSFVYTAEVLARARVEGEDTVSSRPALADIPGQSERLEDELGVRESWVRLSAASNLGSANAIWLYVDTSVAR